MRYSMFWQVCSSKFMCPKHSEAKPTARSEFGAEKSLLRGKERKWLMP